MEKEFVTYKQALVLKELGFDDKTIGFYNPTYSKEEVLFGEFIEFINRNNDLDLVSAPFKQQAFRWFREVTGWDFAVIKEFNDKDYPYYFYILFADTAGLNKHCKSYEEAESLLIDELIENYKFGNAH